VFGDGEGGVGFRSWRELKTIETLHPRKRDCLVKGGSGKRDEFGKVRRYQIEGSLLLWFNLDGGEKKLWEGGLVVGKTGSMYKSCLGCREREQCVATQGKEWGPYRGGRKGPSLVRLRLGNVPFISQKRTARRLGKVEPVSGKSWPGEEVFFMIHFTGRGEKGGGWSGVGG